MLQMDILTSGQIRKRGEGSSHSLDATQSHCWQIAAVAVLGAPRVSLLRPIVGWLFTNDSCATTAVIVYKFPLRTTAGLWGAGYYVYQSQSTAQSCYRCQPVVTAILAMAKMDRAGWLATGDGIPPPMGRTDQFALRTGALTLATNGFHSGLASEVPFFRCQGRIKQS